MDGGVFEGVAGVRALVETLPLDGPHATVLGRARDALCARALAGGLTLVACESWAALEAVNRQNLGAWVPILHRNPALPAFWIGAVDGAGDVVGCQAGLLVDCTGRSFGDHLQDLSLFYGDGAARPEGESCFVGSGLPFETTGPVCWIAAGWTRPDYRSRGLFHLVGRTVKLVSLARWTPSFWCGVVTPDVVPQWSAEKAGARHVDARPSILYRQAGVDRPPLHFLRFTRMAVLHDLHRIGSGDQ